MSSDMAQYDKWCAELEDALAEPFPAALVEQKKQGGASIDFVAWHHYTRRLNLLVGGNWNVRVARVDNVGGKTMLTVAVTICGQTRENVGDEDSDHDAYGTASTNAYSQAYKRACALFGLGLSMYDKKGLAAKANGEDKRPDPIDALAHAARKDVRDAEAKKAKGFQHEFTADNPPTACPECGGRLWDNREKKATGQFKPTSSDFSCRDKCGFKGIWLHKTAKQTVLPADPFEPPADPFEPPADLWGDER